MISERDRMIRIKRLKTEGVEVDLKDEEGNPADSIEFTQEEIDKIRGGEKEVTVKPQSAESETKPHSSEEDVTPGRKGAGMD